MLQMTDAQKAALVRAALASSDPAGYLLSVAYTFGYLERIGDARLVHRMVEVVRMGRPEVLDEWRATWEVQAAVSCLGV